MVVKFGSETHLTRGYLIANGTQVRPLTTNLGLPNGGTFTMKNQIEVEGLNSLSHFFQPGDSGSAVFTRRGDGSLECIGMAIGMTSNLSAVVTPINAILKELGPDITLAKFPMT